MIRSSLQSLTALLDAVPTAVLCLEGTTIVYANEPAHLLFGWSPEELKGRDVTSLHAGKDGQAVFQAHPRREIRCRRQDGREILCLMSATPLNVSDFSGLTTAIYEDVTERRESDQALLHLQERLAIEVSEKTKELKHTNERLSAEIKKNHEALEDLARQERFLVNIFSSIQDGLAILDRDRNIVMANPTMEAWYDHTAPLTGKKCYQALHQASEPCLNCPVEETIRTGNTAHITMPIRDRAGNVSGWCDHFTFPLLDVASGTLQGVIAYSRNISDKVRVDALLRTSEERFRTIVENAHDGIAILDENLQVEYVNEECSCIVGHTRDELLSMDILSLITNPDRDILRERFNDWLREAEAPSTRREVQVIRKDGGKRTVEIRLSRYWDSDNHTIIIAHFLDITEQRQMERTLKASEDRYRQLVDNSMEAIFILQDGYLRFFNPRLADLLGYPTETLTALPFISFVDPQDRRSVSSLYVQYLSEGAPSQIHAFRVLSKNGGIIHLEAGAVRILWEDKPAALIFARNVSVQKRLEAQLMQAQKMEAIGTLAGGIAHNFNNLLTAMEGYISLILLGNPDINSRTVQDRLKYVQNLIASGSDLTRQLLAFARGGHYEIRTEDLNELVTATSEMFGKTKREVTVARSLQADLWVAEIDRTQFEQVLLNLYVNAWQAMPLGGRLILETANVDLDVDKAVRLNIPSGRYIRINVGDTGIGMDEKTISRIFDPFFTTKELGQGTGLGLSTVYGIIQGHSGSIDVQSQPGKGTTFSIYLPASDKALSRREDPVQSAISGKGTILVIDDEASIREVTGEMLEHLGYSIITAANGLEGIQIFQRQPQIVDLVILDMIMPELDGGKTFDALRAINPSIKVLLSSGYSYDGEAKLVMDRGANAFIQKPFRIDNLSRKIRELLGNTPLPSA